MQRSLVSILAIASLLLPFSRALAAEQGAAGAGLGQDRVTVDEKTEATIRGALKWLASKQNSSGSWSGERQYEVAMTGYCLMAFLGAGQLPDEGEYGRNVTAGVNFLLGASRADGLLFASNTGGNAAMYSHGIASIALSEIYGQTKDPRIKGKVEAAIRLIVNSQNDEGGWRYQPRVADADMSVTVLQVVALRAAKNAGIEVPQATIERAVKYVQSCHDKSSGGFTYQPRNNAPGFARTAAAIYSLQVCGRYDDPMVKRGSDYLFKPKNDSREWFTYGQFYAAPAQYMIGGETWEKWYRQINEQLLKGASREGDLVFWDPGKTGWDSRSEGGAIYTTAVYTHILAMPYHYVPLYQR